MHPGSATSRECCNQNYCQGVSQFKYLRKCHHQKYYQGPPQSKVLSGTATGTATINTNDREIKYIQGVQLTEVQQESMNTRKCNMQMYFNSVPQLKTLQESIIIEKKCQNDE